MVYALNQLLGIKEMFCMPTLGVMTSSYWTSGINSGTENATTYGWCATGQLVDAKLWANGEPRDPEANRCVALTLTQGQPRLSGLEAVYCAFRLPLICQFL
jgi:hypothetical protein